MIIREQIQRADLGEPFTKAVADISRGLVAIGCAFHADCADELVQDGSRGEDCWGFNIYPDGKLEFVSLINVRPKAGNRTLEIQDEALRDRIVKIAQQFLPEAHG